MLDSAPINAVVATTDLARAREFYEGTLGLQDSGHEMPRQEGVLYNCGQGSQLLVYARATAGDSEATVANWQVDDVDGTVEQLRGRGVSFEEYDMGDIKTENGVASFGDFKAAWFKDPDGNILCVSTHF